MEVIDDIRGRHEPASYNAVSPGAVSRRVAAIANELIDNILTYTDRQGRIVSDRFLDLPDKSESPDYYERVKQPIDFNTIRDKATDEAYNSLDEVQAVFHHIKTLLVSC